MLYFSAQYQPRAFISFHVIVVLKLQVLDCLPKNLPWTIPESEFEYRRDLRRQCIFTIDPSTARDLDDSLSCEDLGDGLYSSCYVQL